MPRRPTLGTKGQALNILSMPRRLMVGQQPLELFTVVRIHAGQQK